MKEQEIGEVEEGPAGAAEVEETGGVRMKAAGVAGMKALEDLTGVREDEEEDLEVEGEGEGEDSEEREEGLQDKMTSRNQLQVGVLMQGTQLSRFLPLPKAGLSGTNTGLNSQGITKVNANHLSNNAAQKF